MRSFSVGNGQVQTLVFTPDSRALVVDLRGEPRRHPWMGFNFRPATELAWWDILSGTVTRRFRLRDSLYGPGGSQSSLEREEYRVDQNPNEPAFDVSFCLAPLRVATAWEWTNKEDGVCVFDVDRRHTVALRTPYKTHTQCIRLSPDGSKLLAATVNDMDGSALFEIWNLSSEAVDESPGNAEAGLSWWDLEMCERPTAIQKECANPLGVLADLTFDGRFLAAVGERIPILLVWGSRTSPAGKEPLKVPARELDWDVSPHKGLEVDIGFAPRCLAFFSATSLLAVGGAGLVLFDPLTSMSRRRNRSGASIAALAFNADGRELVCGTASGSVELWDNGSGRLLRTFEWGYGPISAVAVSPDGSTCAAGTETGQIIVWDQDGD